MGMDISTSLDYLIEVLQTKLYNGGDAFPEYTGGSDIASKIMYISKLFKVIYKDHHNSSPI